MPLQAICEKCGRVAHDKAYRVSHVVEEVTVSLHTWLTDDKQRIKGESVWLCQLCMFKAFEVIHEALGINNTP